MKRLLAYLFIVLGLGLTSHVNAQEKKLIAALNDWTGGNITCQVAVSILEDELGYKIKRIDFPSGTGLWEAIAKGDIDFACEEWPSYSEADTEMLNENLIYDGKIVYSYSGDGSVDLLGTTGIIGQSDYYIPKYAADKFRIKSWKDLNKHKKEFATIETGSKGRLIGCPVSGWNCHDQKRLDLLGIDFLAEELGTERAAISEAIKAYNKKKPFLLYLWEPHWFLGEFEMVPVKLPEYKYCSTFTAANNWKDCGAYSWPATGWFKDYTFNYGNPKTFEKPEHAKAKAFFERMRLENIDQAKMLVEVDIKKRDFKEVVNEWLDNNPDKWKSWLEGNSQIAKTEPAITPKKKEEFKPENKDIDNDAPVIEIAENITVNDTSYIIEGKVTDKSKKLFVQIDGETIPVNKGKFKIKRFSPVDEQLKIIALDQWGNKSKPKIVKITIDLKDTELADKLEQLNPSLIKSKSNKNRVALIIGIEKYEQTPAANFANLDAQYFYEYARKGFGIPKSNIKLLVDEDANLVKSISSINKWLPSKIKKNKTELIIFFAGHGLASNNGEELYILPQDSDPDLLSRTALSRTELFEQIITLSPKSVTMFMDTCYSGISRDEKMLLASARPIRIVANDQEGIPNNFTIFTASKLDQISSGLEEVKHGIFSYYLMKGLEGEADSNQDKKITNGELLAYMDENVSQKAAEQGREQNPSLAGDPDKVLMSYR